MVDLLRITRMKVMMRYSPDIILISSPNSKVSILVRHKEFKKELYKYQASIELGLKRQLSIIYGIEVKIC